MPFFTDVLRVAGAITAPVLAATGVGLPLALGIGAVAAGAGTAGADAIDRNAAANAADQAAAEARRNADAAIERQRQEALASQRQAEAVAQRAQEQAELPQRVIDACRSGNIASVPGLLRQMDQQQFDNLGLRPLGVCPNASVRQQVQQMLDAEMNTRIAQSATPRPR